MQQREYQKDTLTVDSRDDIFHPEENLTNPFPGLRPFEIEEFHLFFGREKQVDEILLKLSKNRFIGVLGYSGSGKSSIMYCGVIPMLYGGFMTETGPDWEVITARPGSDPLENLTNTFLKIFKPEVFENPDAHETKKVITSILRSGSDGISKLISQFDRGKKKNYFILIDQFEELFRFKTERNSDIAYNESVHFVELLIDAIKQNDLPIYVALTMRSDYVGECSIYNSLTGLINKSNYLVPRMSHEQKRFAIEGPISVGGGKISTRLVFRLLSDIGDNQDQLPILQHALMRTWNYWVTHREEGELLDVRHYNAIGKMSGALSQHADEIYEELNTKQKEIAEILFKSLTQKGQDNQGVRRAAVLGDIAELSKASVDEVIEVVDKFRQPGRSFLMPAAGIELTKHSLLEISHESLMRIWIRLKTWVDEEYESSQMYIRLSEAAEMYQVGKTGLWRPPDLQLALNWQNKQKPSRAWASRYHEAFERAIVFLDTSRITYEAEQRNQEMLQKRLYKRARIVAIILGTAAVIAIVFFLYGVFQQNEAEIQRQQAIENYQDALRQKEIADEQRKRAEENEKEAKRQAEVVRQQNETIRQNIQRLTSLNNQLETVIESERVAKATAQANAEEAKRQAIIAQQNEAEARKANQLAEEKNDEFLRLLYLQTAQDLSQKALSVDNKDLKGLLSLQAFYFNKEYKGKAYDPWIYNGVYSAISAIDGKTFNTQKTHNGAVRDIEFPNGGSTYYSTGYDGKVIKNELDSGVSVTVFQNENGSNEILAVSNDQQKIVVAGDSSYVFVFDVNNSSEEPQKIRIHEKLGIKHLTFRGSEDYIITAGEDGHLLMTNINTGKSRQIRGGGTVFNDLVVTSDGNKLIAGGEDGRVSVFDLNRFTEKILIQPGNSKVKSVALSPDNSLLGIGTEDGQVILWNMIADIELRRLIGHSSRVSDITFSKNGKLLASASLDKTINMWVIENLEDLPIVLDDNESNVWDIEFSPDSHYLLAACANGDIRRWTTLVDDMANGMCDKVTRNMTQEEWNLYVNNPIVEFENTCVDKLIDQ